MSDTLYPADFPIASGLAVVRDIRQGKVKENAAEFAHNLWVIQGYAMKATFGDPTTQSVIAVESFDAVAELEKLSMPGDVTAQSAVPWKEILMWSLAELAKIIGSL